MRNLTFCAVFALSSLAVAADLPELHKIQQTTLRAPYSCGGSYGSSALYLSAFSKSIRAPELLYNGACGSENYIQASTAGDDFALIADLGDIRLEDVTASMAFNLENLVGRDNTFKQSQPVALLHTYAVLISKPDIRALYLIRVVSHEQDGAMKIRYAVKSYSIQATNSESEGFSWKRENR